MTYLLDTYTLVWLLSKKSRLSDKSKEIIANPKNEVYVSIVSFWELSLKTSAKKMNLNEISTDLFDLEELEEILFNMRIGIIGINEHESLSYHRLPKKDNHKDPFDRMLVWQAICRQFSLISSDKLLEQYRENGLRLCW